MEWESADVGGLLICLGTDAPEKEEMGAVSASGKPCAQPEVLVPGGLWPEEPCGGNV